MATDPQVIDPNLPHGGIELADPVDDDPGPDQAAPFDPMAKLTLAELDSGSRLLRASIVAAISTQNEHYERALPIVVWLWARRSDPTAALRSYTAMTWAELHEALAELSPKEADDPDSPTAPGPASS